MILPQDRNRVNSQKLNFEFSLVFSLVFSRFYCVTRCNEPVISKMCNVMAILQINSNSHLSLFPPVCFGQSGTLSCKKSFVAGLDCRH